MSKETQLARIDTQPLRPNGLELDYHYSQFEETMKIATAMSHSGMVPRAYANNPRAILVAGSMGAKFGFDIHQSLSNIANINGTPSLFGDGMLAVCEQSGELDLLVEGMDAFEWLDNNKKKFHLKLAEKYNYDPQKIAFAICRRVKNKDGEDGKNEIAVRHFTIDMAKDAGLLNKDNWRKNPLRMLQMRARSYVLRDLFSDKLKGLPDPDEASTFVAPETPPEWQQRQAKGSFIDEQEVEDLDFVDEADDEDEGYENVDGILEDDEDEGDNGEETKVQKEEPEEGAEPEPEPKDEADDEDKEEPEPDDTDDGADEDGDEAEDESEDEPEPIYKTSEYDSVAQANKMLDRIDGDEELIKKMIEGEERKTVQKKAKKLLEKIAEDKSEPQDMFEGV